MNTILLLFATLALQVATSSVVQQQDVLSLENNFEAKVNPITIEEKDLVIIDGKRYYISVFDANLFEAQTACQEFGMNVISLETQAESDSVYAHIIAQNINFAYYTSGVRIYATFKWSSMGSYLNYTNWAPDEPTDSVTTNQACIYFYSGVFYDDNCSASRRFICEDKVAC